jgi:glucosamine--fructose-6-phosphate aminotransferase (isomerizing)
MCGIVGYIGYRDATSVLFNALEKLEYRGYDSCGIAIRNGGIKVYKDAGVISKLGKSVKLEGATTGVGHTRWATHGKPSRENAHPHTDSTGRIAVVHNGIITNYQSLKDQLLKDGCVFVSETDTETIPHLIRKYYRGSLEEAVDRTLLEINGSYAIAVISADSDCLIAARKESPLIIGVGDGECFIASDVPAILDYTNRVIYLEDGDKAVITSTGFKITNNGNEVIRQESHISWSSSDTFKAGYKHFMLKEIHEQPKSIQNTLEEPLIALNADTGRKPGIGSNEIIFIGCGSSYHAALFGKYLFDELTDISTKVELASEVNYRTGTAHKALVIGITQSGETADTLLALKKAKAHGNNTMAITNVPESSITRIADRVLYTKAGPEVSVAATKSFTAQLALLSLLAISESKESLSFKKKLTGELRLITNKVRQVLDMETDIAQTGKYIAGFKFVSYIARGINTATALEGALKLKEIAYIHAEGCCAGELKHGAFALLGPDTPVIAIVARDNTYDSLLANIQEIKAREAPVIAIAGEGDLEIEKYADRVIKLPEVSPVLSPIINSIAVQLLAYYAALERGCPIDKPRNLAKCVTVV